MRWFIATCVVFCFASPLLAQPVTDRLPASTLVYVGWTASDALKDSLPAKLLGDEQLALAWHAILQQAILDMPDDVGGPRLSDHLPKLLADAAQLPGCLAVLNLSVDRKLVVPEVVLVLDLGNKRKSFEEDFQPLHNRLKDRLGDRLHMMKLENSWLWLETNFRERPIAAWGFVGDSFLYYRGPNAEKFLPTLLAGHQAKALKDDATFADAMAKLPGDALLTTYCTAQPLLQFAGQALTDSDTPISPGLAEKWPNVLSEIGLDNVKSLVEKTTLDNGQFITHSLLRTDGPPHGLLTSLIGGGVDEALLKCAPEDSTFAMAGRFDLASLYDQFKASSIDLGGDDMKKQFDQMEQAAANQQLAPKDALAPLGDQWLVYNAASTGGWFFFGTTIVGTVKDEKKIGDTINVLTQMLARNADIYGHVTIGTKVVDGVTISHLNFLDDFSLFSPSWAVSDGRIFIALYPQVCEDAVAQAKAGTNSLLDNPAFVAAHKRVGDGPMLYFSGPQYVKSVYPLVPIVASLASREFAAFHTEIDLAGCVPSLRQALALVGEDAAAVQVTADGILKTKTQADPLLSELTLDSPALWIAASTPLLQDSEKANFEISALRLRQIGQACQIYANDNKTQFPPDMGTAVVEEGVEIESALSADSDTTVPADFARQDKAAQIAWINQHTDFVYLGGGQNTGMTAEEVLAYEKPEVHGGAGGQVLFADGHVDWLAKAALDTALAASKKAAADRRANPSPPDAPDAGPKNDIAPTPATNPGP